MNKFLSILCIGWLLLLLQPIAVLGNDKDSVGKTIYIPPVEYKAKLTHFIAPAALITAGVIFSQTDHKDIISFDRKQHFPRATPVDDFLTVITGPSVFLLDLVGEEKNHPLDQLFLLGGSYICAYLPVLALKHITDVERPAGGKKDSFPSAHTALAFAGAHVVYKEFKDSNKWLACSGYVLATTVGVLRMANNRHWLSDVLAGAGFGILGAELSYLIYFPIRNYVTGKINKKYGVETSFAPIASQGSFGMSLSLRF